MLKLHYHVSNGGDGSANVEFHATAEEAKRADESQLEGWGESSAGSIDLEVRDGKIYFSKCDWSVKPFRKIWIELT